MYSKKPRFYLWITLTVLSFLIIAGCDKNNITEPGKNDNEPPQIPPLFTMVMDFSSFASTTGYSVSPEGDTYNNEILSSKNWGWAALNVAVWNSILTVTLAIPVASFVESFSHEPVRQPDGSWLWSYNFRVLGVLHTAELYAKVNGSEIQWDMYISRLNGFTRFNWYSGKSNFVTTEGNWTLYKQPDDPTPVLGIDWHRNLQDRTADIKYMNIIPNDPENGGYIFYGVTNDPTYDGFYEIYHKGKDNHTDIKCNLSGKNGRVRDPLHFGDNDWHCWNQDLQDIECP